MPLFVKISNEVYGSKLLFIGSSLSIIRYFEHISQNDFMFGEIVGYIQGGKSEHMQSLGIKHIGNFDFFLKF